MSALRVTRACEAKRNKTVCCHSEVRQMIKRINKEMRRRTISVGCDMVHIERIRKLSDEIKRKIFHPSELKNTTAESLAGIFAVKESCKKIFNELQWLDIEVRKLKNGKPEVFLPFAFHGDVSISHDGGYALAVVVSGKE